MSGRLTVLAAVVALLASVIGAGAAPDIGVAAAVNNRVTATLAGAVRDLVSGDRVFQEQVVETAARSSTQLLFRDETALTVGPDSRVVLDRFVYDPSTGVGSIVFNSTRGAFRFVSGSARSDAYRVRTPVASIGVRGTIWSWFVALNGDTVAVCEEGSIEACNDSGQCVTAGPGEAIIIRADGTIVGPVDWDGRLWEETGGVPFPLFARRFENDYSDRPTPIDPGELNDALDNTIDRTPPPPVESGEESF